MNSCSPQQNTVCLLATLRDALNRHGEITLRRVDLGGLMGLTEFETSTISLAPDLTPNEWRTTLAHELIHLLRGPVPNRFAATEEAAVRQETAVLLFPAGQALAELDRQWSEEDIQRLAARYAVDREVIVDTVHGPPTLPFPRISTEDRG